MPTFETAVPAITRKRPATLLLLLAFACCTIPLYIYSLGKSETGPFSFYESQWASIQYWLASADCARRTGALLSVCQGDRIVAIADMTAGDDPGHALTLEFYAMLTGKPLTAALVSRINSTVNLIGIALLAALLFGTGLGVAALVVLVGGPLLAIQYHALGPHPANLGVACLAAILPITIVTNPANAGRDEGFWFWFCLGVCSLAAAMLYREAIGLMGVVACAAAAAVRFTVSGPKTARTLLACIAMAGIAAGTVAVPKAILTARDIAFNLRPADMMQQHGAWHNLYIGLGAVSNPFGLAWDDNVGFEAVKRIDPSVRFLSNTYYEILKREYLNVVIHHPWQVFVVYMKKLMKALGTSYIGLALAAIAIAFATLRRRLGRMVAGWLPIDGIAVVCLLFVDMFLAQAMLFHPAIVYLFPVEIFLLIAAGVTAQLAATMFEVEPGPAPEAPARSAP